MEKYNTEKEVWKDVEGYEGYYQVSNLGRVRSLDRTVKQQEGFTQNIKGNIKDITPRKDGYIQITLYKNNKGERHYIHRLVAKAFIRNPKGFEIINHIDEKPSNNYYKNLEWCDHQYNLTYGDKVERVTNSEGYKIRTQKLRKPIYVIDKEGNRKWYDSLTSAARELNLDTASITACLKGRNQTHKGYSYEYA